MTFKMEIEIIENEDMGFIVLINGDEEHSLHDTLETAEIAAKALRAKFGC